MKLGLLNRQMHIIVKDLTFRKYFICACVAYMYVCTIPGARRGHQVPWNWSYRQLMLEVEPGSSGKAADVYKCWIIPLAPRLEGAGGRHHITDSILMKIPGLYPGASNL